jgi:hypothetical protein
MSTVDVKPNFLRLLQYTKSVADYKVLLAEIKNVNKEYRGSRDSVAGIATRYWPDGPGIESRCRRDFAHLSRRSLRPTQPPIQWVSGSFPGAKRSGRGLDYPLNLALSVKKEQS